MADEGVPKRRRVTQACENCRALKSKCDGKPPVCNRCKGYGYTCRWKDRNNRFGVPKPLRLSDPNTASEEVIALRHTVQTAHDLLRTLRGKLDQADQKLVDSTLANPTFSPGGISVTSPRSRQSRPELLVSHPLRRGSYSSHRYLGAVSDVSFFNSVKQLLQSNATAHKNGQPLESYEREGAESSESLEERSLELPDRTAADKFVEIYFSTIHSAYPFICRQQFMDDYEKFWNEHLTFDEPTTFNAMLLTLFAIGSYYNVCTLATEQFGTVKHSVYFQKAVLAACEIETERSVDNVRLLLAQCFYLLATCQTDRCWMTLGLAIRMGQSIGLHVEEENAHSPSRGDRIAKEFRCRTWNSLYVLDRLLALQLGRPSAIRNRDCNIRLPCRLDDGEFNLVEDTIPSSSEMEPKSGDYFIFVIQFSTIIGHVMRDVYRPSMCDYSEDMLARTDQLDAELLNWRAQLPRWLRFDRGHTFERSPMLKRQRNMLAIKFHHLRALIHRPYLCLPWLQRNDTNIKVLLETHGHRVVNSERICVREAQETAHMLHDVTDKKSLVEDFPWWQMISCLICASSILLVMRTFASSSTSDEISEQEMLEEDADTCLKVFDALSTNSDAARLARDMLQKLRESKGGQDIGTLLSGSARPVNLSREGTDEEMLRSANGRVAMADADPDQLAFQTDQELGLSAPIWNWQDWPSEMADSMTWSSKFVDTLDPAVLGSSYG